jgi:hypothetical protein
LSIIVVPSLVFIMLLSNILVNIDLVSADTLVASIDVGDHPLLFEYDPNSGKVDISSRDSNALNSTVAPWGCTPELTKGCIDMTNASSTYLSIAIGAVVGAFISWLVYALQKKSTIKQEENLKRLKELDERHDTILELIQQFQKHQEKLLDQILSLDKKIDAAVEKKGSTT